MNWIQRLVAALGLRREPAPREVLDAHLAVLLERFVRGSEVRQPEGADAAHDASNGPAASALQGPESSEQPGAQEREAGYHLQVEAGLTHLKMVAERPGWVSLELPLDAFLLRRWSQAELIERTAAFGFAPGQSAFELTLRRAVGSPRARRQFAAHVERVLHELLAHPHGAFYSVSIEQDRQLDNASLLDSFRELARKRDMESRRQVYQELINGRLLLPLSQHFEDAAFPQLETRRSESSDKDSLVAVTDLQALADYRDPPGPFVTVSGIRLVQAMRVRAISGLLLNPSSRVGGELLPNEIDMLADYLQTLGLLHAERQEEG